MIMTVLAENLKKNDKAKKKKSFFFPKKIKKDPKTIKIAITYKTSRIKTMMPVANLSTVVTAE